MPPSYPSRGQALEWASIVDIGIRPVFLLRICKMDKKNQKILTSKMDKKNIKKIKIASRFWKWIKKNEQMDKKNQNFGIETIKILILEAFSVV